MTGFTSEVEGIGAILSQHSTGKLHSCAYLSFKLFPAERNYDVGNSELLQQGGPGGIEASAGRGGATIPGLD